MSFANLFSLLLTASNVIAQAQKIFQQLNNEKEKAKEELKRQLGQEVELKLAVIKTREGVKGAILIDLPGDVEASLGNVLRYLGVDVEFYEVRGA